MEYPDLPILVTAGLIAFLSLYAGKLANKIKLPSLIGFMIVGVLLSPSLAGLLSEDIQSSLQFITKIALGFVALSIGMELHIKELKRQGPGIMLVILTESFGAFLVVGLAVFLLTKDPALALIFGAIAPASAPAGTVAIIQEYRARGPLTKALYTVVGFDDGLGIIIFGFAFAVAKAIISSRTGLETMTLSAAVLTPFREIGLSILVGLVMVLVFTLLSRTLDSSRDRFILTVATVLFTTGLCEYFHLSEILTNMIVGMAFTNTQPVKTSREIDESLRAIMPLLFLFFFTLAGANLHIAALPSLGVLGLVYILGRAAGLMGGAWLGTSLGRMEDNLRKYLGMGILSQAGVAIGLSLVVKQELSEMGSSGIQLGAMVITTVTATCIFFEIIGPILTKIGLTKAGEISLPQKNKESTS
ncbi:cation:proton antiporter [Marispirochaeta sp.]|jgi:Kef-type K+ transport system membrane component KefB|uniref:cation:proton antiporter n=1 Tax=Marispirochaeta sp. TaxID=2038653 RepID=UPI0029C8182B|nr:cation:proton antiporter [Marispirochaeta sp.]